MCAFGILTQQESATLSLRFGGKYDVLKLCLNSIPGIWREVNSNQKQFRTDDGGILNWYPTTGLINFQGQHETELRTLVEAALAKTEPERASHSDSSGSHEDLKMYHVTSTTDIAALPEQKPPTTRNAENAVSVKSTPVAIPAGATAATEMLGNKFSESELVLGLVAAVGTDLAIVRTVLEERLKVANYKVIHVKVTTDVIPQFVKIEPPEENNEFNRISTLMDAGNEARYLSGDNSILALGVASFISSKRLKDEKQNPSHVPKQAYIVSSLKHPSEVERLREIYPQGFYLIGVHADYSRRVTNLNEEKRIELEDVYKLIKRDEDEHLTHGQRVTDTFHLSDFFIQQDENTDQLKQSVWRILNLLFGNPYVTPTFDEYAMFLAFAASLRSADLSRQVGAVIASRENQVIATGANDCPKFDGGLYWPNLNAENQQIEDQEGGRDYKRGSDSNKIEQQKIIEEILNHASDSGIDRNRLKESLLKSRIGDLTEFGRVVHAEMEALLSCARSQISTHRCTLYCTTFPCHNCAKHIIAAGIHRVVFIEPYQKSKAAEFHPDSIQVGLPGSGGDTKKVWFEPFVGVGPRRFFDLFSVKLGSGYSLKRKTEEGKTCDWKPEDSKLRLQMLPVSYLELELLASEMFNQVCKKKGKSNVK